MTAFELRKILEGVPNDTQVEIGLEEVDGFWVSRGIADWDADEQTGTIILAVEDPE